MNGSEGDTFRLVAVYASTGAVRSDFFRRLETFLGESRTLVLVGNWNSILHAWKDCVGLVHSREVCKSLENLLGFLQLSDRYQLGFPDVPV